MSNLQRHQNSRTAPKTASGSSRGALQSENEQTLRKKRARRLPEQHRQRGLQYVRLSKAAFKRAKECAAQHGRHFFRYTIPKSVQPPSKDLRRLNNQWRPNPRPRRPDRYRYYILIPPVRLRKRDKADGNQGGPSIELARSTETDKPSDQQASDHEETDSHDQPTDNDQIRQDSLRRNLALLIRGCRSIDRLEEKRSACEDGIQDGKEEIDGIEQTLEDDADAQNRDEITRPLEAALERKALTDEQIKKELSNVLKLENELHQVATHPDSGEPDIRFLERVLPQVSYGFFRQLTMDIATRGADRQNRTERETCDVDLETVEQGLEVAKAGLDECKADPDHPWQDTIYVERRVDECYRTLSAVRLKRDQLQHALDQVPQLSRSRVVRLCELSSAALVEGGFLAPSESLSSAGFPSGAEEGEKADIRKELEEAKQTLSDARWKFDHVRQSYDTRLGDFETNQRAGRSSEVSTRSEFDRQYFVERNLATSHIKEAEEAYTEVLKRAFAAGALPENWEDSPRSEFGDIASGKYPVSQENAFIASVDAQKVEDFKNGAKQVRAEFDPNQMLPSPPEGRTPSNHGSGSIVAADSASQDRMAAGRDAARIQRWKAEQDRLGGSQQR